MLGASPRSGIDFQERPSFGVAEVPWNNREIPQVAVDMSSLRLEGAIHSCQRASSGLSA